MILFAADNHYDAHPGKAVYSKLKPEFPEMKFYEDDWSCFERFDLVKECDLLILNMIADTCNVAPPDEQAEIAVRAYCENGGNLLFLHGGSAAFWPWDWWRSIVGFRWVRGNDPDGMQPSTHPKRPYKVTISKCRHELCDSLVEMDLPEDEIYINLEQTCPVTTIMETTTDEGTFPQCHENLTPWGGKIIGFIPGHSPQVTQLPALIDNITVLINYLTH